MSQSMSQAGPLAERGSEGMKGVGGTEDDFCRLREGCQQGKNCQLQEWRLSAEDSDRNGWGAVGYHTVCLSVAHYTLM